MKIHPMWHEYPIVANELTQVLNLIEKNITTDNRPVADAILDLINAGGKLLRPAYCLLFSQFHETDRHKMVALAAAMETLHTATLIHDDIIDDSDLRRGQESLQAQFGKDTAVYAGDYLFVVCFKLLANYASDLRSVQQDGRHMEAILNGELDQMAARYNLDMTIKQYIKQVSGKTGHLFALSSLLGAYESGSSRLFAKNAETIGLNVGIAFQLLDDILDYSTTSERFGKPVQNDMREGVYSAPLILAMRQDPAVFAPYLSKKAAMTDTDTQAVASLVNEYHGVALARELAEGYTDKALKAINKLPNLPAQRALEDLTASLLNRQA
ncbi:polyprenyl synthetase family protein [Furfurilactobacillus curtus]|uniref:Geranylgeranyl pyrophosphate synthase n=1 Tax=Furfurilactobacillus curtus TaxID=1746200 RepID=A0ABQ5JK94_9LACO